MRMNLLTLDEQLRRYARVPSLAARPEAPIASIETATLLGAGAVASMFVNLLRFRLGIPGSSIVFATLPIALGFALVPRRGAGLVMTGGAAAMNVALWLGGFRLDGIGAQTSLLLTGPLLDLALRWSHGGWRLYAAFIAACAGSNALAFIVRGSARLMGVSGHGGGGGDGGGGGGGGGGSLYPWWPVAVWTYAAAGVIAGLISAAAWFQLREPRR